MYLQLDAGESSSCLELGKEKTPLSVYDAVRLGRGIGTLQVVPPWRVGERVASAAARYRSGSSHCGCNDQLSH